ncbi:MAG: hypothetical protein SGILL_002013 [Bacillariaceae sp.]
MTEEAPVTATTTTTTVNGTSVHHDEGEEDQEDNGSVTPPAIPAAPTSGSSFTSIGSESGGFFSLGESNLAERAKKLKEEREASKKSVVGEPSNDDSSNSEIQTESTEDLPEDFNEYDFLFISHQTGEKDNIIHQSLVEGFKNLKVIRDPFLDDPAIAQANKDRQQYAAQVNFIDPTTVTTASSSSPTNASKTNMLQQQSRFQKHDSGSSTSKIENVYEHMTYIFERDYRSTLRNVQHKNVRTGETSYIETLPVNPVITRAGQTADDKGATKSVNAPWGGTSSTAIVPGSDPAEWHTGPFCHVYIAACESMEHYRTKVRPALQAFVSQIESAASNTAGNQKGGHSADYLIVYVPVGGGATVSNMKDVSSSDGTNGSGRVGLFQKARKRWTAGNAAGDDDDAKSTGSVDSSEVIEGMDVDDPDAIAMSVALNLLSKSEQKVYKKIIGDFPNGKACVLSTISLDHSDDNQSNPDGVAIRTQEWNTFNRMLGTVIVNGFVDRCRRYKEELKRLDAQRATAATAAKNSQGGGIGNNRPSQKPNPYAFNLSHFFLVKESLAFTYEQMQLPVEALLQYDEFRLYMPDLSDKEERKVRRARRKSKALRDGDESPNLAELADAGDFLSFRKRIRSEYDLTAILDIIRRYLFARELSLLFRMEDPVELLTRCQAFIRSMYAVMLRGVNELSEEVQQERKTKAAMWVIQFSWDLKCATDVYFRGSSDSADDWDSQSGRSLGSDLNSVQDQEKSDRAVASRMTEVLEITRLMYLDLGDSELSVKNPIRDLQRRLPDDLKESWPAWSPVDSSAGGSGVKRRSSKSRTRYAERQLLLKGAFSSAESYEEIYLDISKAAITLSQKAKRKRFAGSLQAEIGEYHVRKGDLVSATRCFKQVLKRYRVDQWDGCHFWGLFRIAFCQRSTASPTDYLKTLVSCFNPRLTVVAPKKALCALQSDLEAVLLHPRVGDARYGKLAFIETSFKVLNATTKESTIGEGESRKNIIKQFSSVGESIDLGLSIRSYLPRAVEINSVKAFIIAFADFAKIMEDNGAIEEEDAHKILALDAPLTINPGMNKFTMHWTPSGTGQFVLSTIEFIWKQGFFYYDSLDLPDPLIGIDVLPSEPTHSISLDPSYLTPSHDQEMKITVDAGSDVLTSGKLFLTCTEGISLIPPGEELETSEWTNECEIQVQPCSAGEKQEIRVHVRCGLLEKFPEGPISLENSMDNSHGLTAKLSTTYLNPQTIQSGDLGMPPMKTALESFVPVLEKTALSVESIQTHWLQPENRFLLNIHLTSNTPSRFSVDEWRIHLPTPVVLSQGANSNEDLLKRSVSNGDQLSFTFECKLADEPIGEADSRQDATMHLKLRDHAQKVFSLDLALDTRGLFSDLAGRKESSKNSSLLATLQLDELRGQVGRPIALEYVLDFTDYEWEGKEDLFSYSIQSDGKTWLVGGQLSGMVKARGSNLSFQAFGIPLVPGELDQFPKIVLTRLGCNNDCLALPVDFRHPKMFQSIPNLQEVAVAKTVARKER